LVNLVNTRTTCSSSGQSSATVLSGDPVLADVAATALMIDGLRGHHDLALSLQIEDFLLISESREIIMSRSLAEKIEITVPWPVTIIN
jgi:hypothetical protein